MNTFSISRRQQKKLKDIDFLLVSFYFQEHFQNIQICYRIFVPTISRVCLCFGYNIFKLLVIASFRLGTFCNRRAEKYRLKK